MGLTDLDVSYASARVQGLKGRLLESDVLLELAHARSLADLAANLAGTEYAHLIQDAVGGDINEIEIGLYRHLASREAFVLSVTPPQFQPLIRERITRNEIILLKDVIYSKEEGRGSPRLKNYTFLLTEPLFRIHVHLLEAGNIPDLIHVLKGTRYYQPLEEVYERLQGAFSAVSYNAALERLYYSKLLAEASQVRGDEKEAALSLILKEAEYANLLVYARCMNLTLSPTGYTIPLNSRFHRMLNRAENVQDIIEALDALKLGDDKESMRTLLRNNDVFGLEMEVKRLIKRLNGNVFLSGVEGVARILAYLKLKETEVQNIWSVTSGKINGLSNERIRKTITI